jgi:hypothetical protein
MTRGSYLTVIFGVVTAPPIPAATKQTTRKRTRPSQGYVGIIAILPANNDLHLNPDPVIDHD